MPLVKVVFHIYIYKYTLYLLMHATVFTAFLAPNTYIHTYMNHLKCQEDLIGEPQISEEKPSTQEDPSSVDI